MSRALPRADTLLDTPRQRLDRAADRLPAGLIAGVQRRKVRLSDISGSLRPSILTRQLAENKRQFAAMPPRLANGLSQSVERKRDRLKARTDRLTASSILRDITRKSERLTAVSQRFSDVANARLDTQRKKIEALDRLRETLGYVETLKRGYAVVHGPDGVLTSRKAAKKSPPVEIEFADGRLALDANKHG